MGTSWPNAHGARPDFRCEKIHGHGLVEPQEIIKNNNQPDYTKEDSERALLWTQIRLTKQCWQWWFSPKTSGRTSLLKVPLYETTTRCVIKRMMEKKRQSTDQVVESSSIFVFLQQLCCVGWANICVCLSVMNWTVWYGLYGAGRCTVRVGDIGASIGVGDSAWRVMGCCVVKYISKKIAFVPLVLYKL